MIDNMFIVNPPKEIRKIAEEEEKTTDEKGGILDIDYLDFDALEDNALDKEDAFEFTELDINLLDVDFLQDVLDIVAELDKLTELDRKSEEIDSINIEGTTIGFDQDTQYNTLVDKSAGKITLNREVSGKIRITQPIYSNARIVTITDQKPSDIILGDGSGANNDNTTMKRNYLQKKITLEYLEREGQPAILKNTLTYTQMKIKGNYSWSWI